MRCFLEQILPHHSTAFAVLGVKDGREVMRCKGCGLIMCSTADREQYLQLYKETTRYFELVGAGYTDFEDRFQHDYVVSEARFGNLMQHAGGATTLLDVGTGNGALLRRGLKLGFICYGVDLNEWMLSKARELVPAAKLYHGELTELSFDMTFDVITFIDVFEHLLNVMTYVARIDELLSPGGLLVLETPDTASDGWRNQRLEWAHCKPLEHPFLYNEKHIRAIFGTIGLAIVDKVFTIPGRCTYYLRRRHKRIQR